jgi:hypothetical protein
MAIKNNVEMANDEGADPDNDTQQDKSRSSSGERNQADEIKEDDPHKIEKLANLGHTGDETAEGPE